MRGHHPSPKPMLPRARAIRSLHRAVQAAAGRRGFADGAIAENAAQVSDQSILLAPRPALVPLFALERVSSLWLIYLIT